MALSFGVTATQHKWCRATTLDICSSVAPTAVSSRLIKKKTEVFNEVKERTWSQLILSTDY
jgi:hypothetical protein